MAQDSIEKLYKNFAILADAKGDKSEHEEEFKEILNAVKGGEKEKRLASQFIPRFFKHFPSLSSQALDAQFDLCEDLDISIRKQAIKDLPNLCRENKDLTYRVADALTQLLQAEDHTELNVVQNSLSTMFKISAKGAVLGLFNQVKNGEDGTRERALKYLHSRKVTIMQDVCKQKAESFMIGELKKIFNDSSSEEIPIILDVLGTTKHGNAADGLKNILVFIADHFENEKPINVTDEESVERMTLAVKHIFPSFSTEVPSNRLVSLLCHQIVPQLKKMNGFLEGATSVLDLMKLVADCCTYCTASDDMETNIESVYNLLLDLIAEPASPEGGHEAQETNSDNSDPGLQFSYVECMLYALHRLARFCPNTFGDTSKLKAFRMRLQYVARSVQGYIRTLQAALKGKTEEELMTEENKLRRIALKTTTNINTLIKDFFHTPPSYKSVIILSWRVMYKVDSKKQTSDLPEVRKRKHDPIHFDTPASKMAKIDKPGQRELYQPPSGKYSSNIKPPGDGSAQGGSRGRKPARNFRNFNGGRHWGRNYAY